MGSAGARTPLEATSAVVADGGRTPGDITALLVELGRLVKARQFYPDRHPLLREIFERGFRAFEAEVRRAGPLELELRQGAFRLGGEPIGRGRVDDLAQDLVTRAVRMLRFDAELTPDALEHFVAILATERERIEQSGGFVKMLYAKPCPGVSVNEMDYAAALAQAGQPRGGDGDLMELEGDALGETGGVERLGGGDAGDAFATALALLGDGPKPEVLAPSQQLEQAPLDAESADDRTDALVALLRELDTTTEDARYGELATETAVRGAALADDGLEEDGYRAILVLAGHAGDRERSEGVRAVALECLRQLARGKRLDDLIDRSCAPGDRIGMRAAQILLRLGASAVPTLLRRVEVELDLDRRGQLFGVLIAMGDATTPELCAAMESSERRRSGVAVRLAGEMQNAGTVGHLATLLAHEDADLRREAAKALVRIGSPDAVEALVEALDSPQEGVPGHAAFCLGVAGGSRALEVLIGAMRREGNLATPDLPREAARALGRLGRAEAVPELSRILARKSFFGRKRLRELQLVVVASLARIPGEAARAALELAAAQGGSEVREAAVLALTRDGAAEAQAKPADA